MADFGSDVRAEGDHRFMTNRKYSEIREVPGHPGYFVSPDGRVFSEWARGGSPRGGQRRPLIRRAGDFWHELVGVPNNRGYPHVVLSGGGRQRRTVAVHSLVALVFLGPPPPGKFQVRHLDGNPGNPSLDNLAWGSPRENGADRLRHGTDCRGERSGQAKLTEDAVREIRKIWGAGGSTIALARRFGVSPGTIVSAAVRRSWSHVP